MTLTYKIQEAMELQRETEALQAGVPEQDIEFSRHCGIDQIDVQAFREISGRGVMIIVRCPKITLASGILDQRGNPLWLLHGCGAVAKHNF
jgi:hypothetical protein